MLSLCLGVKWFRRVSAPKLVLANHISVNDKNRINLTVAKIKRTNAKSFVSDLKF